MKRGRAAVIGLCCVSALSWSCAGGPATGEEGDREIVVAAASDLRPAFDELGELFSGARNVEVTFSYGSSGQLAAQIVNGAPFDVFASADVGYVDQVIASARGAADTKADYAYGRVVLVGSSEDAPPADIVALAGTGVGRVAIANPDHAPYGRAAKQALERAGVWEAVEPKLVYGENIADTLRIVQSGNAGAGIVALSLAIASGWQYVQVPEDLHDPLRQALVVTSVGRRSSDARAFARFVGSPDGRRVMVRFGFVLPGEESG